MKQHWFIWASFKQSRHRETKQTSAHWFFLPGYLGNKIWRQKEGGFPCFLFCFGWVYFGLSQPVWNQWVLIISTAPWWYCWHCNNIIEELSLESFRSHLTVEFSPPSPCLAPQPAFISQNIPQCLFHWESKRNTQDQTGMNHLWQCEMWNFFVGKKGLEYWAESPISHTDPKKGGKRFKNRNPRHTAKVQASGIRWTSASNDCTHTNKLR